jgi:UDP-N-acetyl-D-mannosaminuronic acid dehydrogenase
MSKKIVVVGIGYVGMPLALMLAKSNFKVIGVDIDKKIVENLNNKILPFPEKDIEQIFFNETVQENFIAKTSPCEADIFIICVPTPLDERKRVADLSFVENATESIIKYLKKGNLVIVESTIPPLTCRETIKPILEKSGLIVGKDIFLAHCPERILPGDTFQEIVYNDRVIGGINKKSALLAKEVYSSFVKGDIFLADDVTAELVKLMENTYRDVNIALANEFAAVAETLGVNVKNCIEIANNHPRVNILYPGIGTGGHCIPIDPWFIHQVDPYNSRLIYMSRMTNEEVPQKIAEKIRKSVKNIKNPKIIALGVTYKPEVNDIRHSPSLRIVNILRDEGYNIKAYDPFVKEYSYKSIIDVVKGADCLVILVEHLIFKEELKKNEKTIKRCMNHPLIVRFYQ